MDAFYQSRKGIWSRSRMLWEALRLDDSMEHLRRRGGNAPFVVAVAGAGGKTSIIKQLAWEGRERGLRVLVLTTTHMYRPFSFGVLDREPDRVREALDLQGLAVTGHLEENGKISFQGWEYYCQVIKGAQLVLVEADGSKRLPLKVPGENEPVLPEHTDLLLCVYGLSALGRPASDVCFRQTEAEKLLGKEVFCGQWQVERDHVEQLMELGYLKPLREKMAGYGLGCQVLPVFHQADTEAYQEMGRDMLEKMGEEKGIVTGNFWKNQSFELF